jgi:hypothetical protein
MRGWDRLNCIARPTRDTRRFKPQPRAQARRVARKDPVIWASECDRHWPRRSSFRRERCF